MDDNEFITLEDLKERITLQLDEITFLDLLGMDIETLVDDFEDQIKENWDVIVKALYE